MAEGEGLRSFNTGYKTKMELIQLSYNASIQNLFK